jgi:hypothetical protein
MTKRFKPCSVDGCSRNAHRDDAGKKGFCSMHYSRSLRHGDPTIVKLQSSPAKDWVAAHKDHQGDECLKWPFALGRDGYGRIHRDGGGALTTASNYMCEVAHGPRPSPRHECAHSCGKGREACVNPRHLYWATPQENQNDRVGHGTSNRGTRQWKAKLTEDDIRAIRAMSHTAPQSDISALFDIDRGHISAIINRKKWAWLN